MPDLARYLVLGAFIAALAVVIVIHIGNLRARQRRANNELVARRLASLGEYLDAGARRGEEARKRDADRFEAERRSRALA